MACGRKPADQERHNGKSNRQRVWAAIRAQDGFTCHGVSRAATVHYETTKSYLAALRKAGYIGLSGELDPSTGEPLFKLLRNSGTEAPALKRDGSPNRQGLGNEAMWRALRILGETTIEELTQFASAAAPITMTTARLYLHWLAKAGYVLRLDSNNGRPRYRLIPSRYSGPAAPMVQRNKQVYDPNLGAVVWRQE